MGLDDALRASPTLLIGATTTLGLLIGSFLNVVTLRLPRMLEAEWKQGAREMLDLPPVAESTRVTLSSPPSTCPHCGARIRPWHNLPIIGWLLLRGRCADCKAPISVQYPLVELITGAKSGVCAAHFGFGVPLAAALGLTWALVALTVIDLREQLLPDIITLPLMWVGLILSVFGIFATAPASIGGAVFGYLSLWTVFQLFRLVTGKEGMGYGDFKLLAALGAWFGIASLPIIILLSSVVGAGVGLILIVIKRYGRDVPIAFGPYLAGAGWLMLLCGRYLSQRLFHIS